MMESRIFFQNKCIISMIIFLFFIVNSGISQNNKRNEIFEQIAFSNIYTGILPYFILKDKIDSNTTSVRFEQDIKNIKNGESKTDEGFVKINKFRLPIYYKFRYIETFFYYKNNTELDSVVSFSGTDTLIITARELIINSTNSNGIDNFKSYSKCYDCKFGTFCFVGNLLSYSLGIEGASESNYNYNNNNKLYSISNYGYGPGEYSIQFYNRDNVYSCGEQICMTYHNYLVHSEAKLEYTLYNCPQNNNISEKWYYYY